MSVCISPPCQSVPVAFNSCQLHSSCAIFTHLLHFPPAPQPPPYLAPKYFECRRTFSFGKERTRRFCSLVQRGGGGKLPSYLRTNHPSRSTSAPPRPPPTLSFYAKLEQFGRFKSRKLALVLVCTAKECKIKPET